VAGFAIIIEIAVNMETFWATKFLIAAIGGGSGGRCENGQTVFTPGGVVCIWGVAFWTGFYAHSWVR
jgi:hypothetical protein